MNIADHVLEECRKNSEIFGIWQGGDVLSLTGFAEKIGMADRVILDGDTPFEGRHGWVDGVMFTQHWHGGINSGDWWWTAHLGTWAELTKSCGFIVP